MADYYYKEENLDKGINPIKIAILGALAGAVGTGVAMALSNPKNRQKIQQTMQDSQKWMNKTMEDVSKTATDSAKKVHNEAEKRIDSAKHTAEKNIPLR